MLKTYHLKTQCKDDIHSSKTANIILPGLMTEYRWTPLRVPNRIQVQMHPWMLVETTLVTEFECCFACTRKGVHLSDRTTNMIASDFYRIYFLVVRWIWRSQTLFPAIAYWTAVEFESQRRTGLEISTIKVFVLLYACRLHATTTSSECTTFSLVGSYLYSLWSISA